MKNSFAKISFPVKLIIIGLIPLLFMLFFAAEVRSGKKEKTEQLQRYRVKMNLASSIMELINQLQLERRYSFNLAITGVSQPELYLLRRENDERISALAKDTGETIKNFTSYTFLDSLKSKRKQVDSRSISAEAVMDYYTQTILRLNSLASSYGERIATLKTVEKDIISQKNLSEMITYLVILRAEVYSSLYYPNNRSLKDQGEVYEMYQALEKEFKIKGSPEAVKAFDAVSSDTNLKNTLHFIRQSYENGNTGGTYTAEEWWDISADGVDQLKAVQRNILDKAAAKVSHLYDVEKRELDISLFVLILIIALVSAIVSYTIHSISQSLKELQIAAEKLAAGATDFKLKIHSNDVVGSLTKSIKQIKANNYRLAEAAAMIGRGNFNIDIQPRSKADVLGNAILHMKKELQQYSRENEEKIYIQTGAGLINASVQGEKPIQTLAKDILNTLVNYLEAELGLFYVRNENQLEYAAGYALENPDAVVRSVNFGETLIGQAAASRETFHLKDIPENFPKISSGTGTSLPVEIIIFPLIHNDYIEGVIEISSLKPFTEDNLSLIKTVSPTLAVAVQSSKSRSRLQELLEETQAQSEELQAQHTVLENLNTELEAQTQKLQASEEELKVQQEELLQANQELEERSRMLEEKNQVIVERNLDIQKKAEELELSTKYKSEFLANMSHELRTPLNSILLLSRLMGENNEKNLTSEQVEYAKVIQSSGNGLLALIDEILDLSKIEAGKMNLEYEEVPIDEIVSEMRKLFTPLADEKNIQLEFQTEEDVPYSIITDRMRLSQILKNLLSNALKFTSRGFIKLKINLPADSGQNISFTVKDTGIGIPKEKQKIIFEAFQQADGSTQRRFGGTGLGLSICRELAKLLGGQITLNSTPGEGSEFILVIPQSKPIKGIQAAFEPVEAAPVKDEEIERPNEQPEPQRYIIPQIPEGVSDDRLMTKQGDKAILIIEDDRNFAKALLDFTRKKGYKGIVSVRGDEGVALALEYKPLAILLDIQLPVKDGWQVMEELKSNPETRHIPVHVMSSLEAKRESLLKGAIDFINKPVALEQMQKIFKKLEDALKRHPKKVLIVEENPQHAKALAFFLETFSIHSEISESIAGGVNALQKKDVDCVILDMGVPDQHVYETLETIKKNPGLENLPIIIFTGKNLLKAEESRLKQYADSIVMKTAHSYQRILDEVGLFLHIVEEKNSNTGEKKQRRLGMLNEVLKDKTVLIADDDIRNIFSLTKSLEQHKMKVISATDGSEALRLLEENPRVDIVLMDMMMPEMDGYESTARIRKMPQFKNLPILAVTAKAMTGDREKCVKAGASDYISKPVDIDQLISLLRVWLYDKSK